MDIILKTGFGKITHDIVFNPSTIPKGRELVNANHVYGVEEIRNSSTHDVIIKARVIRQTSISESPYSVHLFVRL